MAHRQGTPRSDPAARLLRALAALPAPPSPSAPDRVLAALAARGEAACRDLAADLSMDPGGVSRIVAGLHRRRLLRRRRSREDRRTALLVPTAAGSRRVAASAAASLRATRPLLAAVPSGDRDRLLRGLEAAAALLRGRPPAEGPVVLRPHRPGDLGWLVHRHGVLYARERGWGGTFEGIVAAVAADFLRAHDPRRERCWIAERDGEAAGGVLLVSRGRTTAQLRLLLVEPVARGAGIGRLLVDECVAFAAAAGYRKVVLWTDAALREARALYRSAGFRPMRRKRHADYGGRRSAEMWERAVAPAAVTRRNAGSRSS